MRKVICCLAVVAIMAAIPALANIQVRVVDKEGVEMSGVSLTAYHPDGWVLAKLGATESGVYSIPGSIGDKVIFDVHGYNVGSQFGIETTAGVGGIVLVLQAIPDNDTCDTAIPVAAGGTALGSTVEATDDLNAPTCGTSVTAPGVWHSVTGAGTELTVSLCNAGTNYDTKLNVYCLDCEDPTCVAGNDDGGGTCSLSSQVTFCAAAGVNYNVLVQGYSGATGDYEMTVTDSGIGCTPDVICEGSGACCSCLMPPYNCTPDMTAGACADLGSTYAGDGTSCTSSGTPLPPYTSTPGLGFIDYDTVTDTIAVTDNIVVGDVDVIFNATHTWVSDLDVTLIAPDGTAIPVWMDACGSNDDVDVTFDNDGNPVVCGFPTVGIVDPLTTGGGDLGGFAGIPAMGDWTISVYDDAGGDTGTLVEWGLILAPIGAPTCPDPPVCGNGIVEDGEDCDDGNNMDGDGCSANCGNECQGGGGQLMKTICHKPGTPAEHTISVAAPALWAHYQHGDWDGACPEDAEASTEAPVAPPVSLIGFN
jgi:cysteine-rich repeat protein